jgi:two-component system, chemotaxis family, CheB/CheR fusion protein
MFLPGPTKAEKKTGAVFPIVCIGGSAGSLSAYVAILREMPARAGMAVVIVSHRALLENGRLIGLLAGASKMEVVEVSDGMVLEPDRVYVAPPQTEMTTDGVKLKLATSSKKNYGWPTLISNCMLSLASECSSRVIAIIVSGMGHDGSGALAAVKKGGGWTLAQSDASYEDMPQAAIGTDRVDFVLRANEIGRYLASLSAYLARGARKESPLRVK